MTYRVLRAFDGAKGVTYTPGTVLSNPAFPAENLKALVNQHYLTPHDPTDDAKSKPTKIKSAGRSK